MVVRLVGDAFDAVEVAFLRTAGFLRVVVFLTAGLRAAVLFAACGIPGRSSAHLPDITRCAASATASAIRAPNFVALETML
ncbi:MAG: hypothetical protein ABIR63_08635, partial [Sphingomicrobium sp.]